MKHINYTDYTKNTFYESQYKKFQIIERWVLNCALRGSNITNELVTWNLVCIRLESLKSFIDSVILEPELNVILHNRIDNILDNADFKAIYLENYSKNKINTLKYISYDAELSNKVTEESCKAIVKLKEHYNEKSIIWKSETI